MFIPTEADFRKWIKEAVKECMHEIAPEKKENHHDPEGFVNRKKMARILEISLVTLTDWMKRGLPCHKQRGRVYFLHSEVVEYIRKNRFKQVAFTHKFP